MGLRARLGLTVGIGTLLLTNWAGAQDSLQQGKTPAQLFASDCAICHKSPQGLAKGGGLFGVQSFLRQHYTTSRETAAAIAAYLEAVDRAAGPEQRRAPPRRATRRDATGKPEAKKPEAKPGEAGQEKGSEGKPSDSKPSESKASESKPAEPKAAEPKPSDSKPSEAKASESKPAEVPKLEKTE